MHCKDFKILTLIQEAISNCGFFYHFMMIFNTFTAYMRRLFLDRLTLKQH